MGSMLPYIYSIHGSYGLILMLIVHRFPRGFSETDPSCHHGATTRLKAELRSQVPKVVQAHRLRRLSKLPIGAFEKMFL